MTTTPTPAETTAAKRAVFHSEVQLEFVTGGNYLWYQKGPMYVTRYAFVGLPTYELNRKWLASVGFLHVYFRCAPPHVPAVVAAQLSERILRGCLLFADAVLRVPVGCRIDVQEVEASEHPFLHVDNGVVDPEPHQFVLQPESEGTAKLVGGGPLLFKDLLIHDAGPRDRIGAFVISYKRISARTSASSSSMFEVRSYWLVVFARRRSSISTRSTSRFDTDFESGSLLKM